jgi:hypothetical protein
MSKRIGTVEQDISSVLNSIKNNSDQIAALQEQLTW